MSDHPVNEEKSRFRAGKGLHVESKDGDFALATRVRAQMLYEVDSEGEWTQSMQIRRARVQFGGHFYGKNNTFKAELAVSPGDVGMKNGNPPATSPLLDFYFEFTQLRDLSLRVGQYKVPHTRQRVVSSGNLRMVDRSIVNKEFTLDRDIGADFRSKDFLGLDMFRYYAGVFAGEGRNTRTDTDFGMMYLVRAEFLPFGDFDDYQEGDLERVSTPKVSLGVGYGHIVNSTHAQGILGSARADGGTTDFDSFTADLVFRLLGFSIESEFVYRDGSRNDDATDRTIVPDQVRRGFGLMGQAGYLFPSSGFEVVARGSVNRATGTSALPDQDEYGLGLNYYFADHPFKLQADWFRLTERAPGANAFAFHQVGRVQLQASF